MISQSRVNVVGTWLHAVDRPEDRVVSALEGDSDGGGKLEGWFRVDTIVSVYEENGQSRRLLIYTNDVTAPPNGNWGCRAEVGLDKAGFG